MKHEMQAYIRYLNRSKHLLFSMLIGGIAGAVLMLLLAPQSGKRTRAFISKKGNVFLDHLKLDKFASKVN